MTAREWWRASWPGLLLATCLLLPFLGKAHALDDVTFLLEAQHLLSDPGHPTAFDLVSDGKLIRLSGSLVSGPVAAYLLVPCVLLGGAEWAARIVHLALVCLGVFATTGIALRLGRSAATARTAGLLLAATPAVIAMATTSMADVPAMAFGAMGIERVLAYRDRPRVVTAMVASLLLALSVLSRAHLALLLPLAVIAASGGVAGRAPGLRSWRAWGPALIAAILVLAVSAITADPARAHGDVVSATAGRLRLDQLAAKFAAFGSHAVLAFPLALPWLWLRGRTMVRDPRLYLAAVLLTALLALGGAEATRAPLWALSMIGLVVITDALSAALRSGERDRVWLAGWLLIALPTVVYVHEPAKYLVPSAPAIALLVASELHRRSERPRLRTRATILVSGCALGLLIASADAEFTDVGRRAARELIAPRVAAGERVWYSGGWGAQWYAMQAGAQMMANDVQYLRSGDIIVTSGYGGGVRPREDAGMERLGGLTVRSRIGRIMSPEDHAGFYSNWFGILPWSWHNGEIEAVSVWRVR